MSLNLSPQLLKVLYYRAINSAAKVGMLIGYDTGFVADAVVDVLPGGCRWEVRREKDTRT